jgi:hypothetical protein
VNGLTLNASDVAVEVNRAAADGSLVDYASGKTTAVIATSSATDLAFDMDGADGALVRVRASAEVDVFGFVQFSGDMALNKQSDSVKLANGNDVNVDVLTVGLSDVRAFAGMNAGTDAAIGLELSGVNIGLVMASEQVNTGTARQWVSLQATAGKAALVGVDGVTLSGQDLDIVVNSAAADGQVIDYAANTFTVATGPSTQTVLDMAGSDGELLRASGYLHLNVMDFVAVQGNLALQRKSAQLQTADKAGTPADEAAAVATNLLTIGGTGLDAFVGLNAGSTDAMGLSLGGLEFALALAQESGVSVSPREWMALQATATSVGVVGIDGLSLSGSAMALAINQADADGVVLDFSDGHALTVVTGTSDSLDLTLDGAQGELMRASGRLTLDVFEFAQFEGDVAVEQSTAQVRVTGDSINTDVNLLTVGVSNASGFLGLNAGTVDAVGLSATGVNLALVVASDVAQAARQWTALQATVSTASFSGVDGLTLDASNLAVTINQPNAVDQKVIDWAAKTLTVPTGTSDSVTLNMAGSAGDLLRVSATLDIDVFDFFRVSGSFALEKQVQTLTLSDGSTISADTLTVGAVNVNAFAGINGDSDDATGLDLKGVEFALLIATDKAHTDRQYTTLQAGADLADFLGVTDLTLSGSDLSVAVMSSTKSISSSVVVAELAYVPVSAAGGEAPPA